MKTENELFELYQKLLEKIYVDKELYGEDELTLWSSCVGKDYNNKLMVVGRAGNGGIIYLDKNKSEYKDQAFVLFKEQFYNGLQWVIDRWGVNDGKYNTKKSAFWRLSRRLSEELIEKNDFVINKIVYSNLYKISNYEGGNPSNKLMDVQLDICRKILLKEMELYKPEIVVFFTGLGMAQWFLQDSKNKITNINYTYVEFVGQLNNTIIIVAQHPQGKSEQELFEEILSAINYARNN